MEKNYYTYDVAVLGGGPAGLSAGIYSARYGLKTLVISQDIGGMANYATSVENYPGFNGSGFELINKFAEQAKKTGVEILEREIVNIAKEKQFAIQTSRNEIITASAVIICLGTEKKKLNIRGEDKFLGSGVSYCATCDAAFFNGKIVSVIGGRNSAAQTALMLAMHAKKVYIIYRQDLLNCDDALLAKIKNSDNIKVLYKSIPLEIEGKDCVEKILIEQDGKKKELGVDGIFIEIGSVPASSIVKKIGLKTDKEGYIIADNEMKTNIKGVFAAGDIISTPFRQIISAAANGAMASFSAYKFLKEENKS
jgi:thioredoxin reductase (NADPH)